ncbi:MAG TPA: hemolysin family protein [Hydrogenophaga sp.]|uniref:hemolysin family protein n=1 Tax=Hydrogenophaga sp. TaxID=1904254 RepID=UPI002C14692D|nr:hemolysin family protein [Hydrogenophaga sp.]HMN94552.1 hemolysin family protein [Hydrogenophaga sp.]HMP10117.1 hemolysin family protein [Hydrogenophaga sp.]
MDILLIAFLTLLSGVFSMTEIAVVSSRRVRIEAMAQSGNKGAQAVLQLQDNPTQFFSTIQMGNTTIALLNGIVGENAFGSGLSHRFEALGLGPTLSSALGTGVVVIGVTYVTIVFGELVSKRIGQSAPEAIASWMARPVRLLAAGARPFVWLLEASTNLVLRLLRIPPEVPRDVTEAELQAHLAQGVDAGIIEHHEHRLVRNVFNLDERQLTSIMVPHSEVEWLDAASTVDEAVLRARSLGHSWYPVCRDSLEHVTGVISLARLLELQAGVEPGPIEPHALPAVFVPETLSGMELLEQFRVRSIRIVMVVDEYGVVQGLLTPMDLLEAITGELHPEDAVDAWATPGEDGSWWLDGAMPVAELKTRLSIEQLPDEDKGRYNTVAGLMQTVAGQLLAEHEHVDCSGWRFQVLALDGRRIDRVQASPLDPVPDANARPDLA